MLQDPFASCQGLPGCMFSAINQAHGRLQKTLPTGRVKDIKVLASKPLGCFGAAGSFSSKRKDPERRMGTELVETVRRTIVIGQCHACVIFWEFLPGSQPCCQGLMVMTVFSLTLRKEQRVLWPSRRANQLVVSRCKKPCHVQPNEPTTRTIHATTRTIHAMFNRTGPLEPPDKATNPC